MKNGSCDITGDDKLTLILDACHLSTVMICDHSCHIGIEVTSIRPLLVRVSER